MKEQKENDRLLIRPSSIIVGTIIAALYLAFLLLIPSQVAKSKMSVTNPRVYPYIVFAVSAILAVLFAFVYRNSKYEINLGIWPLVLGTVLFYLGMKYIGFYITSFFMVLYNAFFWHHKNKTTVLIVATVTPVLCYVFFTLCMKIHLPVGLLFS